MNSVQLVGRLTRDPDMKYTDSGVSIARFSIAVDRRFKKDGNGNDADFISCVAFGKTADFVGKYFFKGQRMGLNGRIQTGSYTNREGQKVYTTDVIVENVEFVESKKQNDDSGQHMPSPDSDDFMSVPDGIDEMLPFN